MYSDTYLEGILLGSPPPGKNVTDAEGLPREICLPSITAPFAKAENAAAKNTAAFMFPDQRALVVFG